MFYTLTVARVTCKTCSVLQLCSPLYATEIHARTKLEDANVGNPCFRCLPQLGDSILVPKGRISADRGKETRATLFSRGRAGLVLWSSFHDDVACIFDGTAENHVAPSTQLSLCSRMDPRGIGTKWISRWFRRSCVNYFCFATFNVWWDVKREAFIMWIIVATKRLQAHNKRDVFCKFYVFLYVINNILLRILVF